MSAVALTSNIGSGPTEPAIYFVDLVRSAAVLNDAEHQTPRLAPDESSRYQNKVSLGRDDANRWRTAHIALRIGLERHAGLSIRCSPYDIEPGGRPRLGKHAMPGPRYHFSLAHAGPYALIAISPDGHIGVDLEVTRQINVSTARRERIERAAARLGLDAPLPLEPDARFLQSWVRLEAVAKASGLGIGRILTEAGVIGAAPPSPQAVGHSQVTVLDLNLPPGCYAALAGAQLQHNLIVTEFPSSAQVLKRFLAASDGQ